MNIEDIRKQIAPLSITARQRRWIGWLVDAAPGRLGQPEKYEFKRFETRAIGTHICVMFEVGLLNDEGTMAEAFCRDRWQIFIGPRGRIYFIDDKGKSRDVSRTTPECVLSQARSK